MIWANIRTTLLDTVRLIDGLDHSGAVEWGDTSEASYARKYPRVDLSIASVISYGDDETRIDVNALDDRMEYISGPRRFTWSIRVEADEASLGEILTVSDRIKARLGRRDAYAIFLDAGLAAADYSPTQVLSFDMDGRKLAAATFDVFVNCAENDQDESEYAGETIEQASIASEYVLDPDGDNNPNQIAIEVSSSG